MFDSLKRIKITLPTDESGLIGRECPIEICKGYFKIKLGTGIAEEGYEKCFCPYCGHESTQENFFTNDQVSYIQSIAEREAQKVIEKEVKRWDKNLRDSTKNSFIKLRIDYQRSNQQIAHYAEQELETLITCENCELIYAVFGKFSYCPDCGIDNTLQILKANLELIHKLLTFAKSENKSNFKEFLIQNSLEDIVSAFDSYGRNCLRLFTKTTEKSDLNLSFQNIINAQKRILDEFGFDFLDCMNDTKKAIILRNFQKRHLITHNDGIVDRAYIQIAADSEAVLGRKISVSAKDVEDMLSTIENIAQNLQSGLSKWRTSLKEKGGNDE